MTIFNKHHGNAPADAIYIGRGSKWGNPYSHLAGTKAQHQVKSRDEACDAYERDLWQRIRDGELPLEEVASLHGKDLVCFCAPQRCHGESLVKVARWAHEQLQAKETTMAEQTPTSLPEFKLIVAGGRDFDNYPQLAAEITRLADKELKAHDVSIVSGKARGADNLAYQFAKANKVLCHEFPADWSTHGKAAGMIRNKAMGDFADGLLAFWDGKSPGTKHMIDYMRGLGKSVRVIRYGQPKAVQAGLFKPVEGL